MTISCKPVKVGVGRIAFEKKKKLFKTESWLRFSGLEWNIAHHFYLSSVRCVVNSRLDRFHTWTIWYAFMHFVLKDGICVNMIHDSLKNKGGFCKHFYLFYLNSLYRWNFVVYILIFDFLVILNNWFYFPKRTNFYGWLSSVWKPFYLSGNFWLTSVLAYSKDVALVASVSEFWKSDCAKWILDD